MRRFERARNDTAKNAKDLRRRWAGVLGDAVKAMEACE